MKKCPIPLRVKITEREVPFGKAKTIDMAAMQASRLPLVPETEHAGRYPWWRSLALFLLLLLSIALYGALITVAPQPDAEITPFLRIWILFFLPYFAACALILATRPAPNLLPW